MSSSKVTLMLIADFLLAFTLPVYFYFWHLWNLDKDFDRRKDSHKRFLAESM
jgi:hypothetical protein